MFHKLHFLLLSCSSLLLLTSCSEKGVVFYLDKPTYMKKEKLATFYGDDAKKECEVYRQLYAGMCDNKSQPYVTCFDLNDKKYSLTSCE